MPARMELKYGSDLIGLPVPDAAEVLGIREPDKTLSVKRFSADLDTFLSSTHFGGCLVSVVVADKTRLCAYDRYLPVLVERLGARGVRGEDITFFIAYGTHPAQSDKESKTAYGKVFSQYRFVHHDCMDKSLFQQKGCTQRGTPIRLRKDILNSDFLITFGAVSHHYFAGFGGGRKLIFPGLGHREAIYRNHSLFLDRERRTLSPGCRAGWLDGNPLAEDLAEIEAQKPADLAIHGILNSQGKVCQLLVGAGRDDFRKACIQHGEHCEMETERRYDLVVASCGGHPKDINFVQAHKAVQNAADFVADGGTLVLLARCPDGVGSKTFLPWFRMGGRKVAFDRLLESYEGNGGTALAMMEKTERIRIRLVTELPTDFCELIGVEKVGKKKVVEKVSQHKGLLAVIPNASLLVRRER